MSRLRLQFLGVPEVWYDRQRLKFATRKSLALLVYLSVAGDRHSREKLMTLLWPESTPQQAQASLRNSLARLRQALAEAKSYILVEEELLSFDPEAEVICDWQTITSAVRTEDVAVLQQAVGLYRGDFLEGFSLPDAPGFDDWATLQREHWHNQMSEILARLSQLQANQGQVKAGLATATRWTALDPLNESAHRRLIELHLMAGDRTAALQAYEACRAELATELAAEPSPETEALAERIRDFRFQADNPKSEIRNLKFSELPFVGRSVKHLQLVTGFHAARQGQTQIVLIEGEPGIGKTRLATEFLAWAAVQGADVCQGRAFEAGGRLPYQPLLEALRRRVEQENAPDDLLSDVWLAELSRLLPEVRDRYPDLPVPAEDETEGRTRLLEAVARLGQALAEQRQPLVIFIDDIQWTDVASLDMLHYCSRSWAESGCSVLLLFTLRSEAVATDVSLSQWLTNLGRDIPSHQLALEPLTVNDIRQMILSLVDQVDPAALDVAQRFSDWLFALTEGHPFFISETFKDLINQDILHIRLNQEGIRNMDIATIETWLVAQSSDFTMPAEVRQLILTRLKRLSSDASGLLTAAAIIGRDCSYARLCQVAEVDEGAGLSSLDELLNSQILIETEHIGRPYTIVHDKIRDVVYAEAGAARRRVFHRRAFEALGPIAAPAAELAYHALAAQLTEPAFHYSLAAGDDALALFAVHDAISHYEQARRQLTISNLQFFDKAQDRSPIANLYLQLGRAYELAGNLKQAETIYQELLTLAQTSNQAELTCTALNRLATVAVHAHDFETAVDYLQRAKHIAEESNNKMGLAETEWSLAQLYHHRFDFQQSLVHSQRTVKLAHELGNRPLIAGGLNALAYAQMLLGQVKVGEAGMVEARDLYLESGDRALEADCLTAIAAAQIWQGRIPDGIETARTAEAICAEMDNPWGHIYSRVWLATGLLDKGDYEAALAVAQAGQNQANAHSLPPMEMFITLILGKVYQALGQLESAYQTHQKAKVLNEQVKSEVHTALIQAELCADCALLGNWAEAITHAREGLAHRRYDILPLVISSRWLETKALVHAGDVEVAREDAHLWEEVIEAVPRFRVGHLRSLAVLAEGEGDTTQAINYLQEALTLAEAISLPGEQWQILAKLVELYLAIGEEAQARQAQVQVAEITSVLGITPPIR